MANEEGRGNGEVLIEAPWSLNALSGASRAYEGLALVLMGLVFKAMTWDQEGSTLITGMLVLAGIALVLYGSVLVVRYDDAGALRRPPGGETAVETPPEYKVRVFDSGTATELTPMGPDPEATPLGGPAPTYASPHVIPPPTSPMGEPGRCPECGGTLFMGRPNCPHCGTPVPHSGQGDP